MTRYHNVTRTSRSIPARLVREGKLHLLPVYALVRTSDLGREGIERSGSYRFADHVYRGRPSGRYVVGRWVDAVLLRLRGARSMRARFAHVCRELLGARRAAGRRPFRILSVPCGIARDLVEVAAALQRADPELLAATTFIALDLDPEPLDLSGTLARERVPEARFELRRGDALDPEAWPRGLDAVASTGLGEFLPDAELVRFYRLCRASLVPGGVFVTSGMKRHRLSDYLARELAELRTNYRGPEALRALLGEAGFARVRTARDEVGLQTLVVAEAGGTP